MRYFLIGLLMLCCQVTSAIAQLSIGIGFPGVSIGINLPLYPQLVQVPGYPVYYAPQLNSNYFFYDGMYWVYQGDDWYASTWYNGPWGRVGPEAVPVYVLRVPVRYYRAPPQYFRGWRSDAPPRWDEHWGRDWEKQRKGWDQWDRHAVPPPAPLPAYQRQYSGDRYPRQIEQQQALHSQQYRYEPNELVVRQHYQVQGGQGTPLPPRRDQPGAPQDTGSRSQEGQRPNAHPPAQDQRQPPGQGSAKHEQPAPPSGHKDMPKDSGGHQDSRPGQGQDKDADKGEGHNKH